MNRVWEGDGMNDPCVKRVLISVTDKTGVVDFARALHDEFGAEIVSTGGTARVLEEGGVPVRPIDDVTGFPEMMDGRVKTLHPKVHGGLLAKRSNPAHMAQAAEHGIGMIDMVVVNLYAFEKTVASGAAAPCGLSIARPVARPRAGWSAAGQGRSFGASGESFLRRRGVRTRPSGRAERFQCSQRCGWHLRVPGGVRLVGDDGY